MQKDNLTEDDMEFLDNPDIRITYGINNKVSYFSSDNVYDYLIELRKEGRVKDNGKD